MRYAAPILAVASVVLAGCAAPAPAGPTVTAARFTAGEQALLRQGKLRADRGAGVPVTAGMLTANFARVAFGLEPGANRGRSAHRLHRREGPVRWWVAAPGPQGVAAAAAADVDVERSFARIARATGLDIARAGSAAAADFHVLFLRPEDYAPVARWARAALGRPEARLIEAFRTGNALCTGSVRLRGEAHERALVLVRAGFDDLLRLGCVEEEIAQALGLANDHPAVRPSVFNDDEEFALLTRHDELLLQILYDRRLRAGMTPAQAMPIVARIAGELRP